VAQNAYCNECGTRVPLTESGACASGHPRSALRDVREGECPAGPLPRPSGAPATAQQAGAGASGSPNLTRSQDAAAKTVGRLIIVVPAVIVLAIGLWTGYAMGVGMGQSKTEAWLWSIVSMVAMGVVVAMIVWNRRRKMNR